MEELGRPARPPRPHTPRHPEQDPDATASARPRIEAKATGRLPGISAQKSAQIKQIANRYSSTTSAKEAARATFAIWKLEGDPHFATWYADADVSDADRAAVDTMSANSKSPPSKISITASRLQVGQPGSGKVKVLEGLGRAKGGAVTLSATGAVIRTVNGANGKKSTVKDDTIEFTYERTGSGKVGVKAEVAVPSTTDAGLSVTPKGVQQTVSGGYMDDLVATYSYALSADKPSTSASCDTDCEGIATLTFKACNPEGAEPVKWTEKVGSAVVATLSAASGDCVSKTAKVGDGKEVTASYCYTKTVGGACSTDSVNASGSYTVVCPAWVEATYDLACMCEGHDGGSVTFTAPKDSIRYYRGFVKVTTSAGTATRQIDLVNGTPAKLDIGTLKERGDIVVAFIAYGDSKRTDKIGDEHTLCKLTVGPPG